MIFSMKFVICEHFTNQTFKTTDCTWIYSPNANLLWNSWDGTFTRPSWPHGSSVQSIVYLTESSPPASQSPVTYSNNSPIAAPGRRHSNISQGYFCVSVVSVFLALFYVMRWYVVLYGVIQQCVKNIGIYSNIQIFNGK